MICTVKPFRVVALLLLLLAFGSYARADGPRQPLPIAELVALSKSGAPADEMLQRLKGSTTTYALRGSDFSKLRAAGVPNAVLDYLQQSLVDDLDLETRRWVGGSSLGGCSFCYPQPVDLDAMQSGYTAPPTRYVAGKPPGTPDWVPYPPTSRRGPRISGDDVLAMVKQGRVPDEIVQRIRGARLQRVTASSASGAIRTHPLAALTGSELAELSDRGVPAAALDALQAQFLAEFIEAQRLHYLHWGKGARR